jgi:hypothetical protein
VVLNWIQQFEGRGQWRPTVNTEHCDPWRAKKIPDLLSDRQVFWRDCARRTETHKEVVTVWGSASDVKRKLKPALLPSWPRYRPGRRGNPAQGHSAGVPTCFHTERCCTRKVVITPFRNGAACKLSGVKISQKYKSYVVGHEQESSPLFQCILSILQLLIIFWCGHARQNLERGIDTITMCWGSTTPGTNASLWGGGAAQIYLQIFCLHTISTWIINIKSNGNDWFQKGEKKLS